MSHKRIHSAILFLSILLFLLSINACRTTGGSIGVDWGNRAEPEAPPPHHKHKVKKHEPPAHAPAHGYRAKHRYRYYPESYVYYDTGRGVYFYMDNGAWQMSVSLPGFIHLESAFVSLEMDIGEPYRYNYEHRKQYPPSKKKHKKKKWD
jgi:hypothetical protein